MRNATEIITTTYSGRALLEAYGVEVITRCKDCEFSEPIPARGELNCTRLNGWDYFNGRPGVFLVEPENYCYWGESEGVN